MDSYLLCVCTVILNQLKNTNIKRESRKIEKKSVVIIFSIVESKFHNFCTVILRY